MPSGERDKLSEHELHELYEFVESGYREGGHPGPVRRLLGRAGRAIGLRRHAEAHSEQAEAKHYDSPLDAVYARAPGLFAIPVSWLRNHIIFGHGSGAFNAWEATARQLVAQPELDYRESVLARFYQVFRPETFAELMFSEPENEVPSTSRLWQVKTVEYKDVYPWTPSLDKWPSHVPAHMRLTEYGPVGDEIVQLEVWRLRRLVESISRDGYRPLESSGTRGYLLKVGPDVRFIVRSGFHRAATLAGMGHTAVPVMFSTAAARLVTLETIDHWPMVKNGLFTAELAERLANNMVSDGGAAHAKRLGFEPHP